MQRAPGLIHSGRGYALGSWEFVCWCLEDALACLGRYQGRRKVDKDGNVSLYDRRHRVGASYAGQEVEVQLDVASRQWVFSQEQQEVARVATQHLEEEDIRQLRLQGRQGRSAQRTQAKRARKQSGTLPKGAAGGGAAPGSPS